MNKPSEQQKWNAQGYAANAGFVPALGQPVLALLAPKAGESVLDLGCGDGVLTAEIAKAGAEVVGVDSSAELLEAAKAKGVEVHLADGQAFDLGRTFDAVFTNAALHWMPDGDAVISCVKKHLKPQGRFVGEFGGHGNVAAIVTALLAVLQQDDPARAPARHPWFFPTPEQYRGMLEKHGFKVETADLIPRPTPLPTGIAGWLETFADPFLSHIGDAQHKRDLLARAEALLAPSLRDHEGRWTADYVRLRFSARAG